MHSDIKQAVYIKGYKLEILFEDGNRRIVNFDDYRGKEGLFQRFNDIEYFKKFNIDHELGVLCWPDGLDIAPETLYAKATGKPLPKWMEEI